jgi:hypothetical protein
MKMPRRKLESCTWWGELSGDPAFAIADFSVDCAEVDLSQPLVLRSEEGCSEFYRLVLLGADAVVDGKAPESYVLELKNRVSKVPTLVLGPIERVLQLGRGLSRAHGSRCRRGGQTSKVRPDIESFIKSRRMAGRFNGWHDATQTESLLLYG